MLFAVPSNPDTTSRSFYVLKETLFTYIDLSSLLDLLGLARSRPLDLGEVPRSIT